MTSIFIDSTSALITALLPMLRRKVFTVIPHIAGQPQLLSHFIHELMNFDMSLRDEWGYDGGCGIDGWKGLTGEVLAKKQWYDRWFELEKDCAYILATNVKLLTVLKLLCRDTKVSSTTPIAAKSIMTASRRRPRNPRTAPSE